MTPLRYHHIIWDFDGTICDTAGAITQAYADALADYGITVAVDTISDHIHGTLTHYAKTLAARHDFDADELMERYWEHLHHAQVEQQDLFPGVLALLNRFIQLGGKHYLLTHHRRASLMRLVDHHRLADFFVEIVTSEQVPRKPDPAGVIYLLENYQIARDDVLMIGDRAPDIQAAHAAGIKACLFGADRLDDLKPDVHITAYDQLATVLFGE